VVKFAGTSRGKKPRWLVGRRQGHLRAGLAWSPVGGRYPPLPAREAEVADRRSHPWYWCCRTGLGSKGGRESPRKAAWDPPAIMSFCVIYPAVWPDTSTAGLSWVSTAPSRYPIVAWPVPLSSGQDVAPVPTPYDPLS
jgi:hypothetical protein